jgi:D-alanyl-D-alanine carboxypeptidase
MSSIVVEAKSGNVLLDSDADQRRYPASLTKLMTLYLAFKALDSGKVSLQQRFPVSRHAARQPPTKLGLRVGQTIPLRQLILGLVTQSANDAAVVIAEGLARTETRFARKMTRQAQELGMKATKFRNASGLPNQRQRTTARDMARLANALLKDFPQHYAYFSTRQFVYRGRVFRNHNRLLDNYPGVDGLKTGYIRASGYNLVVSAEQQGRRVVAVVMGGRSPAARDNHMVALLDSGFETVLAQSEQPAQPALQTAGTDGSDALGATHEAAGQPAAEIVRAGFETAREQDAPLDWAIQVGAFAQRESAEKWATHVMKVDPLITPEMKRIVEVSDDAKGTLFAVRFATFSVTDAAEVCRILSNDLNGCFIVRQSIQ